MSARNFSECQNDEDVGQALSSAEAYFSLLCALSKFCKCLNKGCLQKKKVNFGTLAQKGGGGQSKIPNVDQY